MPQNLSYKQLQEELDKAKERIETLEKVIRDIKKILIDISEFQKDFPMIIIKK